MRYDGFRRQEQYIYTHRLFFSGDALFLVLHNPRSHADKQLEMYLDVVAQCASLAPVILVFTRADECTTEPSSILRLKSAYSQIQETVAIDSKSGTGFENLKLLI